MNVVRLIGLGLVTLGVVGCGGSSSSNVTTPTPGFVISNLRVQTRSPNGLRFTVDWVGSTIGGSGLCNGTTNLGQISIPILTFLNGSTTNSASGTLSCETDFNAPSTASVSGTFSLTDSNGGLSNALIFSAVLTEGRQGGS